MSRPDEYREADQYLYVEAAGFEGFDRKMPVKKWVKGPKAPGGDRANRTTENPYVETYEETDKSGETPYIIIGARDGFMLDIDVDVDEDGHEEVFEGDHDEIQTPDGVLSFLSASGGPHRILKASEANGGGLKTAVGVDLQGDMPGNMGVVTSPFHHPEYEVVQEPTEYRDFAETTGDFEALNGLFGADLFEPAPDPTPTADPAENLNINHGGETSEYDGLEGWFTPEIAAEALEYIPKNVGYERFRNIGFALADHFPDDVALRLFRGWYQGGPRYDEDSDEWAESIVRNATENRSRRVTIGTLIHKAGTNGWEYDPSEHVAVLPEAANNTRRKWGALEGDFDGGDDGLTRSDVHNRMQDTIENAIHRQENALVNGLPTTGKSNSTVKAIAETGVQATILTSRGRKEQYDQYKEWAEDEGLTAHVLPSVWSDCGMFNGECGREVQERVVSWYIEHEATGRDIHTLYERATGEKPPCEGEAGDRCMYQAKWELNPDDYDILLGNYLHANVESVTEGRTVFMDEYPEGAFDSVMSSVDGWVSTYLENRPAIPFDDYDELRRDRGADGRTTEALAAIEQREDLEPDGEEAILRDGHADAAAVVYTLLASANGMGGGDNQFTNGFDRAVLPGTNGDIGVFDRKNGVFVVRRKPNLSYIRNLIALDGTPKVPMWENIQPKKLTVRQVLTDDERRGYLRDTMNLRFVQTSPYMKPYNSAGNVFVDEDAALLEAVRDRHGAKPAVLTTRRAENVYQEHDLFSIDDDGVLTEASEYVRRVGHYGNLKGSNRFKSERVGVVAGSNNYGDGFVQREAAFMNADVSRDPDGGRGTDLSFIEENAETGDPNHGVGNLIFEHMTEDETLQAALRFGRDGGGATVYLHTAALPPILEDEAVSEDGRVIRTYSRGKRDVLEALAGMNLEGTGGDESGGRTTSKEVSSLVDISARQVRDILNDLEAEGVLRKHDPEGHPVYLWSDPAGGVEHASEHGHAALPEPVEQRPELTPGGTGKRLVEVSGSSTYTWNFRDFADTLETSPSDSSACGENGEGVNAGGGFDDR